MRSVMPVLMSIFVATAARDVAAQDLLGDDIQFSGATLELVEYVRLPVDQRWIISMTTQPSDDKRLYVTAQQGGIFTVDQTSNGGQRAVEWFDVAAAVREATGRELNFTSSVHGGVRSLAFHPDFATNGRFYTSVMENRPADPSASHYLGSSVSNVDADSVLVEWTYDHVAQQVLAGSYRELFRVNMPYLDHPIRQIKFNPFARPGDEDYGLLYVTHGDASVQSAITGGGQNRDTALGKILRIDPLAEGDAPYTTPGNPFVDDADTLDEIYALGFRNPHNFSFALDEQGATRLIVADIGRDNIEEINLVEAGANHGWSEREGAFIHLRGGGYLTGVSPLGDDEAEFGFTFPAAQFDHDAEPGDGFVGIAVAGGHVIANGSDPQLQDQYIFGDFGTTGRIYEAGFTDLVNAVTLLDPHDPDRDEPSELTQAVISQLRLTLDDDQDPSTPAQPFDLFTTLLDDGRSDLRFGEGKQGELYMSSKRNRTVYLVANTLPWGTGDLDGDGDVDARDIDLLAAAIEGHATAGRFDLNADATVDARDLSVLVEDILGTRFGDADLSKVVAFADFLRLAAHFERPGGWADGDFNGSRDVDFDDFLVLAANFAEPTPVAAVVPEPQGSVLAAQVLSCLLCLFLGRFRRSP